MRKQPGYAIFLGATILFTGCALLTAWPMAASKPNILGYYSHCTWTPWSTLMCLGLAGVFCKTRVMFFKS